MTLPSPLNSAGGRARRRHRHRRGRWKSLFAQSPHGDLRGGSPRSQRRSFRSRCPDDGALIAAAGIRGSVAILGSRLALAPAYPGWTRIAGLVGRVSARRPDIAHGRDRSGDPALECIDRRSSRVGGALWSVDDPLAAYAGDHGAEVFRACVACHTLNASAGERAGPTLAGLFGRRIASLPGYNFSRGAEKARHRVDARDGGETLRVGPATYTPGTKMPDSVSLGRGSRGAGAIFGKGDASLRLVSYPTSLRPAFHVRADNRRWCAASAALARRRGRTPGC